MKRASRITTITASALFVFGSVLIASPSYAAEHSAVQLGSNGAEYSVTPIDDKTLNVELLLGTDLSVQDAPDGVRIENTLTGESESFPTLFQVDSERAVTGEWEFITETELRFHITGGVTASTPENAPSSTRSKRAANYWDCVARGLQGGAIGGAIAGIPGGPGGAGIGFVFGGLGGSIAGAVTCR